MAYNPEDDPLLDRPAQPWEPPPRWASTMVHACAGCSVSEGAFHLRTCRYAFCSRCGHPWRRCRCGRAKRRHGRYLAFPFFCTRCGRLNPIPFVVSDYAWRTTMPIHHRRDIICPDCFGFLRVLLNLKPLAIARFPRQSR